MITALQLSTFTEDTSIDRGQNNCFCFFPLFTAQCTLVKSAVLRSHDVCLSVCPSVTLVICDHIGCKSWKLTARTISPTPSLLVAERRSPYGLPFPKIGGLQLSYPLLSQEQVKLRTSNLAGTFTGLIQVKAHSKFRRKWSVGISRDCPNLLGIHVLSQERVKLRTSNLAGIFTGPIRINAH